jgi:hypothetical protein
MQVSDNRELDAIADGCDALLRLKPRSFSSTHDLLAYVSLDGCVPSDTHD